MLVCKRTHNQPSECELIYTKTGGETTVPFMVKHLLVYLTFLTSLESISANILLLYVALAGIWYKKYKK